MLALAIALTTATVIVELLVLMRSDYLLALFRNNTLVAVVFSVALSAVLGVLFGAAGMIVLLAAVASTAMTTIVYRSGVLVGLKRLGEAVTNRSRRT